MKLRSTLLALALIGLAAVPAQAQMTPRQMTQLLIGSGVVVAGMVYNRERIAHRVDNAANDQAVLAAYRQGASSVQAPQARPQAAAVGTVRKFVCVQVEGGDCVVRLLDLPVVQQ